MPHGSIRLEGRDIIRPLTGHEDQEVRHCAEEVLIKHWPDNPPAENEPEREHNSPEPEEEAFQEEKSENPPEADSGSETVQDDTLDEEKPGNASDPQ